MFFCNVWAWHIVWKGCRNFKSGLTISNHYGKWTPLVGESSWNVGGFADGTLQPIGSHCSWLIRKGRRNFLYKMVKNTDIGRKPIVRKGMIYLGA